MRFQVSVPEYKQVDVKLNPAKKVIDLKNAACRQLRIDPQLTKLLLNGKRLNEDSQLSRLKIAPSTVVVADYLWARQLLVWGAEGQKKLREATVFLAGAGAIGNEAAKNIAMLGVGRILIADRDRVEMSNISRMIFFKPKDLGRNKAEALAENLQRQYPYVETAAYRGKIESMPLKFYLDSQVVLCGLDNAESRIFLTQTCRKYSIPLIDAGIIGLTGRVHSYIPPDDTCPICAFPPNQYSNIVGLKNPCDAPLEQATVPSFATSISLVSAILSQEAVKVILGVEDHSKNKQWPEKSGEPLRSILFLDLKNNRYSTMKLERNTKCIVCGTEGTAKETSFRDEFPLKRLKSTHGEDEIRKKLHPNAKQLTFFLETSHGTRRMDNAMEMKKHARVGDYLRILAEQQNGELHESILHIV